MINSNIQELKIIYQTHAKKFLLPADFESLLNTIATSFNISKENLHLNYIDEEGDRIILSNELDYEHVLKICNKNSKNSNSQTIKLNLETHSREQIYLSDLTQSLMTIESKIEEDNLGNSKNFKIRENVCGGENKNEHLNDNFQGNLSQKENPKFLFHDLKISLSREIEKRMEEFKTQIVNVVENKIIQFEKNIENDKNIYNLNLNKTSHQQEKIKYKLNDYVSETEPCQDEIRLDKNSSEEKNSKNLTPFPPKLKSNSDKSEKSISLNFPISELLRNDKENKDNILNFTLVKNCKRCGDLINLDKNNFYFCLNCEDVYYCNLCYMEINDKDCFIGTKLEEKYLNTKSSEKFYEKFDNKDNLKNENKKLATVLTDKNQLEDMKNLHKHFRYNFNKHILLKSSYYNLEHIEAIKQFRNFRKLHNTNKWVGDVCLKYFTNSLNLVFNDKSEKNSNIALAFNIISNKILIEIDGVEFSPTNNSLKQNLENKNQPGKYTIKEDFLNIKISLINLSHESIFRNSYLECIFDQSDIFGNKIILEETIQSLEEFELNVSFYNFKNKPNGFYISKWRLINNEKCKKFSEFNFAEFEGDMPNSNYLTFVFIINHNTKIHKNEFEPRDKRSDSFDTLKKDEIGSHLNEMKKINKFSVNSSNNNYSLLNLTRFGMNTLKIPDMFGEIIKKHQEVEKEKEKIAEEKEFIEK